MGLRYIEDLQTAAAGIVHGIGRAAGGFRQIANADAAVIHKVPIAFLHTALKIVLRSISHTNILLKRLMIHRFCCIMDMVMKNEKIHFYA